MWDLPGPGLEPVSPALAGGCLTTVPPGKSLDEHFYLNLKWWRYKVVLGFLHLHCQKCTFLASSSAPTSMAPSGTRSFGTRAGTLALQTELSQKDLMSFHLPSFHLICFLTWQSLVSSPWQCSQSVNLLPLQAFSLFSPACAYSIPFHSPCPQLPAFYPDLPTPNTRSLQHSVYSASLSKLPDAPVENHTIVLIGALTNLWVFGSAETPICSLVGAHSVVSRKLLTAVSMPKCQLTPLPCMWLKKMSPLSLTALTSFSFQTHWHSHPSSTVTSEVEFLHVCCTNQPSVPPCLLLHPSESSFSIHPLIL